ncbi:MAG TPA: hypothetical protein VL202_00370 [Pararhizobium sp.]|uniref:hypothetical protein n=1 Tax=Pararhizobium sp. TaxID=1977563 RepID=UPI002C782729|nr:hypothetical protein [Pararhizobium sp.]HTO29624.1 hypothetical protein [Pararhizobium sp.]
MNKFENATPRQIREAMAEGMRRQGDGCTAHHLKLLGFSQAQLDAHGDAARELAVAKADAITRARVPARKAA